MDETDLEPFIHIGALVPRLLPPVRRSNGARALRRSVVSNRRPIRRYGASHARGGNAENLHQLPLTVVRQVRDTDPDTTMDAEDSVVECGLVDMGVSEIAAHGLDHVEVAGPIVKWVYYTMRWVDGQWERRECAVVSVPLAEIDGGIVFLRERYKGKIREIDMRYTTPAGLRAMMTN